MTDGREKQRVTIVERRDGQSTIEDRPIQIDTKGFVDHEFYPFTGVVWDIRSDQSLALISTGNVFRGEEVFGAWEKTLKFRDVCEPAIKKRGFGMYSGNDEVDVYACAFTRTKPAANAGVAIEYCKFEKEVSSGITHPVECFDVASRGQGVKKVLASRFFALPEGGAGGEAEVHCALPGASAIDAYKAMESAVEQIFGSAAKMRSRPAGDVRIFVAEALKVSGLIDGYFGRAYIKGYVRVPPANDPLIDMEMAPKDISFALVAFTTDFTVSAQSSDDITNYRQPSQAMADTILNRFRSELKSRLKKLAPNLSCWIFQI
jgi:hypothetical protein